MRALEEEGERMNPVRGGGATPSMGLSQVRGGALLGQPGHGTRQVGAGRHRKGKTSMSDATRMGLHLGKHIHSLHGGGFFDDFAKGFMSVVQPVANIASTAMKVAPLFGLGTGAGTGAGNMSGPGYEAYAGMGTGAGTGRYEGKGTGAGTKKGQRRKTARKAYEGGGFLSDLGIPVVSQLAGLVGLGEGDPAHMAGGGTGAGTGAGSMEGGGFLSDLGIPVISQLAGAIGLGKGKKKRAPASAGDGRRKRAAVVRRVMSEQGLSMIEDSKYVKAHGLY